MHRRISRRSAVTRISHAAAGVWVARYVAGCTPTSSSGGADGMDTDGGTDTGGDGTTDPAIFRACLAAGDSAARVQRDAGDGAALNLAGTPTVFVNGVDLRALGLPVTAQSIQRQLAVNPIDPRVNFLLAVADDDHVEGSRSAPGTIIEYGDFECPASGTFFARELPAVLAGLVNTGRAKYVFRHFPLRGIHPNAEAAAQASECAAAQGEENFFPYHDLLFENQLALETADLEAYAAELELA